MLYSSLLDSSRSIKKRKRDDLKFNSKEDQDTSESDNDVETKAASTTSQRTQSWRSFTRSEETKMIKYWQATKTIGRHKDRDLAMFILLRRTELHPEQIADIKVGDVYDTKTKQVMETFVLIIKKSRRITLKKSNQVVTKVNTTARTVTLHPDARKFLLPLCQDKHVQDLLFQHDSKKNKPLKRSTISSAFKYCAQKSGVISVEGKDEKQQEDCQECDDDIVDEHQYESNLDVKTAMETDASDDDDDAVIIVEKSAQNKKAVEVEPETALNTALAQVETETELNTALDEVESFIEEVNIKQGRGVKTPEEKKQWRTLYKRQWRKAHPTKAKEAQRKYRQGRKRQKMDKNPKITDMSMQKRATECLADSKQTQQKIDATVTVSKDNDTAPKAIAIDYVYEPQMSVDSVNKQHEERLVGITDKRIHDSHSHYLGSNAAPSASSIGTFTTSRVDASPALADPPSSLSISNGPTSLSSYATHEYSNHQTRNPCPVPVDTTLEATKTWNTENKLPSQICDPSLVLLSAKCEQYLVQEQVLTEAKTRLLEMDKKLQEKETQTSQLLNLVTKASAREDQLKDELLQVKKAACAKEEAISKELDDLKRTVLAKTSSCSKEELLAFELTELQKTAAEKIASFEARYIRDLADLNKKVAEATKETEEMKSNVNKLTEKKDQLYRDMQALSDELVKASECETELKKQMDDAKGTEAKTSLQKRHLERDLCEERQSKERLQRYYLQLDKDAKIVRENLEEAQKTSQESMDAQAKTLVEFKTISQQLVEYKEAHVLAIKQIAKFKTIAQRLEELHSEMANKPLPERSTTTLYTYSPGVKALIKTTKKLRSDETIPETRVLYDDPDYHDILFKYDKNPDKCVFIPMEEAVKEWIAARKGQRDIQAPYNALYTKTAVKTISGRDPRKALRGGKGLFVRPGKTLEWCELIGFYEGWCTEDVMHSELVGVMQTVAFNEYSFGPETKFANKQLTITAMGDFGNDTRFANDYRNFNDRSKDLKVNAKFFEIVYQGMPYIALIALGHIGEEEEIVVDYGDAYWETMDMFRTKQAVQIRGLHQLKSLCSEMMEIDLD